MLLFGFGHEGRPTTTNTVLTSRHCVVLSWQRSVNGPGVRNLDRLSSTVAAACQMAIDLPTFSITMTGLDGVLSGCSDDMHHRVPHFASRRQPRPVSERLSLACAPVVRSPESRLLMITIENPHLPIIRHLLPPIEPAHLPISRAGVSVTSGRGVFAR